MKNVLSTVIILIGLCFEIELLAAVDPSVAEIRFCRAYVSENEDCSNPVFLASGSSNCSTFNMNGSPTLGQGNIPEKKYKCFIMEMMDNVHAVSSGSSGSACVAGTEINLDICQAGSSTMNPFTLALIPCTSKIDRVFLYISVVSMSEAGENPFQPPRNGVVTNGIKLQNEIDTTTGSGSFIFDTRGTIITLNGACNMEAPKFGFRNN